MLKKFSSSMHAHAQLLKYQYTKASLAGTLKQMDIPSKNPYELFEMWFQQAVRHPAIQEANAMVLSTASKDFRPSSRVVLLKGFSPSGFRFFTNYESQKGKELVENPRVAASFCWDPLGMQIHIYGTATKLSEEESTKYFISRPRASQIGALVSMQSSAIPNSEFLELRRLELEKIYEGVDVLPKPDYWGGYNISPDRFEFFLETLDGRSTGFQFRVFEAHENIDKDVTWQGDQGWVYETVFP